VQEQEGLQLGEAEVVHDLPMCFVQYYPCRLKVLQLVVVQL
jgi:hypothetical protein